MRVVDDIRLVASGYHFCVKLCEFAVFGARRAAVRIARWNWSRRDKLKVARQFIAWLPVQSKIRPIGHGTIWSALRPLTPECERTVSRRSDRTVIGGPKLFIDLGQSPEKQALERERAQIVNNFAQGALAVTKLFRRKSLE